MKGYVQVYTGNGKGKTTAALGLLMRASGAGLRIYFGQFIKGSVSNEIRTLKEKFPEVTVKQYGLGRFISEKPTREDIEAALQGLDLLEKAMLSGSFDLIIADEASCAVKAGLFEVNKLLDLINRKPAGVELVFTGRDAHPELIKHADLVTEMNEVKHYFNDGVSARLGIES